MTIAALLLAAGESSRFGELPKALVDVGETSAIRRLAEICLAEGYDPISVVVGAHRAPVVRALHGLPVEVVEAERWFEGRTASVQAGVNAIPPGRDILFWPVDHPFVAATTVERLESVASRDLQDVSTTVATNWNILPADAEWVYEHIGTEPQLMNKVIRPAISNAVKAVTAHYNAEDLIVERDQVRNQIESQIRSALVPFRVVVDAVNITDFHFSRQFAAAIEEKQVAQQRALQARYELEKAKVLAQQKVVEASAQAQAQKLLQATLTPELIQQQAIAKWNGQLPEVLGGRGVLPMIGNLTAPAAAR